MTRRMQQSDPGGWEMTWQETVDEHGLWAAVEELRTLCQSNGWPDDPEVRDVVARVTWLCANVVDRRDDHCITTRSLDSALTATQAILQHLTGLRSDPPTATPNDVRTAIEQLLGAIAAWPHPNAARISQQTREGMDQYRTMTEEALTALRDRVQELEDQISDHQAQWKQDADAQIQAATAANAGIRDEVAAASTELNTQKQRLDTALTEFATNSQTREKERDAAETTALKQRDQAAQEQLATQKQDGEESLVEMNGLLAQARETLQTIGKEASASHYGTYADEQRRAAFRWSVGVLLALAAAAGFLVWAAIEHMDTWHSAAARYALGAIFVGGATYAGRQSALHRALERQARQRELAIAALGSFLADVPAESVRRLKLAIAGDLFIDDGAPDASRTGYQPPGAQIADAVRSFFGNAETPAPGK